MPDLNLLITLDVLLSEGSVAGAARRLRLSPSAMSRALSRLREVTGDPLLVRAGRRLVPTPRAIDLRAEVGTLVEGARSVLRPAVALDPAQLRRHMTLRTSEGFVETFGPRLFARVQAEAPGVTLRFLTKPDKESTPLRDGEVDLETAVVDASTAPELRAAALFDDRWVAVLREGHALLRAPLTADAYAAAPHVAVVRRGLLAQGIDAALASLDLERRIAVEVGGFAAAIALARQTDLVATVPERHTEGLRPGTLALPLPFGVDPFTISLLWHPRMEGDGAHRWLRGLVRAVCGDRPGQPLP